MICFIAFYIHQVRFYKPVHISISGPGKNTVRIYGVTPLGRVGPVDASIGSKTFLFSDVLIDLSDMRADSIPKIIIQYDGYENAIEKNELRQWYEKHKAHALLPLSMYIHNEGGTLSKLNSLRHTDWSALLIVLGLHPGKATIPSALGAARLLWSYLLSAARSAHYLFSLVLPFYAVTFFLPCFLIILLLLRKPMAAYRIPFTPSKLSKGIFFISLFFYVVLQAYGYCYYIYRFEGSDEIFDIVNYSSHDIWHLELPPDHRYVYSLIELLLRPCFALHLPLSTACRVYGLTDAFFHLSIAVAIIYSTRRYDLAATVLAARVLTLGINFYYLNNELFVSGSFMLLYMAVYAGLIDSKLRDLVLFTSVFFIIWSHPISLIVLAVFLTGLYKSTRQISTDKWLLAFMMINAGMRLALLTGYDQSKIQALNGGGGTSDMVRFILSYVQDYWQLIVAAIGMTYLAVAHRQRKSDYIGLLALPLLLYFCISKMLTVSIGDEDIMKFLYPVHLYILMQVSMLASRYESGHSKVVLGLTSVVLLSGLAGFLSRYYPYFETRTRGIEALNAICARQDPNQSKWYMRPDSLIFGVEPYSVTMLVSALEGRQVSIQIVSGDVTIKKILDTLPPDQYYADINKIERIKSLDPYYFHMKDGPYKELVLSPAQIDTLRRLYNYDNWMWRH